MIYEGYYNLANTSFAKNLKDDSGKEISYYLDYETKYFQVNGDDLKAYRRDTGEDDGNIKAVFEAELENIAITLEDLHN